jgi:5-dehydro-2-deoxygluconokinase
MSQARDRGLDLVCVGRTSVDLYAEQEGAKLEDVQSFRKYVGGSATNIAVGTARLGIRSAMLTRVGDEQMGRYVRKTLAENGVDVSQVRSDPEKLTPYVLLAVRAVEEFPRIFAYGEAADLAIQEEDIDEGFIGSAKALLVTGTPLSRPGARAASGKAIKAAKDAETKVVFDLDYRPVFWGVASHEQGGEMFVASEEVTGVYRSVLPDCDLVVGTEEEIRIAGGSEDTRESLLSIRELSDATIVLKVGAMGAIVFAGEIPVDLEDGVRVPGFLVEVFNSVGAGDAFMSGFLSGWLREKEPEECLCLGNACGAIVVSRHGCSPAMPTSEELEYFLAPRGETAAPLGRPVARPHTSRDHPQGARGVACPRDRPPLAAGGGRGRARRGPRTSAGAQSASGEGVPAGCGGGRILGCANRRRPRRRGTGGTHG